ncbi:MAG TPA: cation:proton antiporter [Burkholderiales bacterium]|nr:cation:proton antiporter [Burkholderiales bacterium]
MGALAEVLKLLLLAAVAVALLGRLRLPPVVSYVLLGAATGPHALGWLGDTETIHFLGELGIAFLLFTLGLEFSIAQFVAMRRVLLVLGSAQVVVCTVSGAVVGWALGLPWTAALIVGGALAMSSTAIIVKQLREQLELQTAHGRLAIGILLFQDLAAIPFLVVIPILAQSGGGAAGPALMLALGKGIAVAAVLLVLGRRVLRPVLHEAGASRELFTLTVLLITLAAAWVTQWSGLSLAFVAFVAGMMLSESEYRHQVEDEIRPFRDVLLGLFFIVVGMQLDPALLPSSWPQIAVLTAGLVIGKGALIALLARAYGYRTPEAARTGLVLAHGGEFSVALLVLAMGTGVLDARASQPVLAAIIVSMLIAPLIVRRGRALVSMVAPRNDEQDADATQLAEALRETRDHVLICGYGRVGSQLVRILTGHRFACVAIDNDPDRVKRGWDAGGQVYYGDATRRGILEAAGLNHATAVVLSFDNLESSLKVMREAHSANPAVPVLARAADQPALDALLDAGAAEVVPEAMETSLMLATQLLVLLGTPPERVLANMNAIRAERYRLLRALAPDEKPEKAGASARSDTPV